MPVPLIKKHSEDPTRYPWKSANEILRFPRVTNRRGVILNAVKDLV
jgi:hypothetical protein